jgi:hypothetical protein
MQPETLLKNRFLKKKSSLLILFSISRAYLLKVQMSRRLSTKIFVLKIEKELIGHKIKLGESLMGYSEANLGQRHSTVRGH